MSGSLIRLQRLIYRNRSIVFTPAGTRFILLTLAVGVAAVNTGNNLLYLILGMMLSLIITSGILSEQSLRKLSVEWRFPARIFARQPVAAEMRITNGKRFLPSFSFRVDEGNDAARPVYIFKLSTRQTLVFLQTTRFERRGLRTLPPLRLHTTFPFGIIHKTLIRPQTRTVLVYPRVLPLSQVIETTPSRAGQDEEHWRRGRGATLHSLRDYTRADDARGIHWKASARESKLLLKEYEREEEDRVHLHLSRHLPIGSGGRSNSSEEPLQNFERAVELTASLAGEFTRRGYAVHLQMLKDLGTDRDALQDLDAVLKALALIEPVDAPMDPAAADRVDQSITEIERAAGGGGRWILILSFPDPAWDPLRGRFSDVLVASEPRFKEWPRPEGERS